MSISQDFLEDAVKQLGKQAKFIKEEEELDEKKKAENDTEEEKDDEEEDEVDEAEGEGNSIKPLRRNEEEEKKKKEEKEGLITVTASESKEEEDDVKEEVDTSKRWKSEQIKSLSDKEKSFLADIIMRVGPNINSERNHQETIDRLYVYDNISALNALRKMKNNRPSDSSDIKELDNMISKLQSTKEEGVELDEEKTDLEDAVTSLKKENIEEKKEEDEEEEEMQESSQEVERKKDEIEGLSKMEQLHKIYNWVKNGMAFETFKDFVDVASPALEENKKEEKEEETKEKDEESDKE